MRERDRKRVNKIKSDMKRKTERRNAKLFSDNLPRVAESALAKSSPRGKVNTKIRDKDTRCRRVGINTRRALINNRNVTVA